MPSALPALSALSALSSASLSLLSPLLSSHLSSLVSLVSPVLWSLLGHQREPATSIIVGAPKALAVAAAVKLGLSQGPKTRRTHTHTHIRAHTHTHPHAQRNLKPSTHPKVATHCRVGDCATSHALHARARARACVYTYVCVCVAGHCLPKHTSPTHLPSQGGGGNAACPTPTHGEQ